MHKEVVNHTKSYQELIEMDFSSRSLQSLVDTGNIRRVTRGTYTSQVQPSREEEHLALAIAFRNRRAETVLTHISAAIAWGLPVLNVPQQLHIRAQKGSHSPQLITHQDSLSLAASTATTPYALKATVPLDTVVACARTTPLDEALVIADSALYQGLMGYQQLHDALYAVTGPGSRKAKKVADCMSTQVMSPGETLLRLRLLEWGFNPVVQCPVSTSQRVFHGDCGLPEYKVLLEFDGKVKYSGAYGSPHTVLMQEKERMDAILNAGWRLIRVNWGMVQKPAHELQAALKAHGVPV